MQSVDQTLFVLGLKHITWLNSDSEHEIRQRQIRGREEEKGRTHRQSIQIRASQTGEKAV